MGINFVSWKVLIVIIPAIILVIWLYKRYKGVSSTQDKLIVIVRCVLVSLIILSLAGMEIVKASDTTSLVFVVDQSSSISKNQQAIEQFIQDSLEYKTDKFKVGIVTFGKESLIEYPLDKDILFGKIETMPKPDFTNMESGLKFAYAMMPSETGKRIVLITDGVENVGDAFSYGKTLARQGVTIDAAHIDSDMGEDAQVSSVELPGMLYEGEEYDIRVVVDSTVSLSDVPLKLYSEGGLIGEQRVELRKGQNIFLFRHSADKKGIVSYEAKIDVDDGYVNNNSMAGFTYVEGKPLIGIVEGKEGNGNEIGKILDIGEVDYELIEVSSFPKTFDALRRYSGLILVDVSLEDISEQEENFIENYVGGLGRGLIVIGGDNSYALGGYGGSTLEKVLPVDMDISSKAHIPSIALMLVIDKSSSMEGGKGGISKLDLAKEAAIRSAEVLRPVDTIGVVAFDTLPSWVVNPTLAKDKEEIEAQIGTLTTGGGTDMYPGLSTAYDALLGTDAKLKHIIALTDGQSSPAQYDALLEKMEESGITLSTVAVGYDADKVFLENLAEKGRGRYYFTSEFRDIPKIFTKEVYMAAESYVQNRAFYPAVASTSPILESIDSFPQLDGYLATSPKPRADVALISDKEDPILASWQYGLGKVVAWTSDMEGLWTGKLLGSDEGARLWLNAISYILPSSNSNDFKVDTRREGDRGEIVAKFKEGMDEMEGKAVVVSPDGDRQEVALEALRPGEYGGAFDIDSQGVYAINVLNSNGEELIGSVETALAVSYSPEYDIRDRQGDAFLERLTQNTGGRMLKEPSEVFENEGEAVKKREDMSPYLLPIIIILFIFDIGLRRVNIGMKKRQRKKPSQSKTGKEGIKREENVQFTTDLLKARRDKREF